MAASLAADVEVDVDVVGVDAVSVVDMVVVAEGRVGEAVAGTVSVVAVTLSAANHNRQVSSLQSIHSRGALVP